MVDTVEGRYQVHHHRGQSGLVTQSLSTALDQLRVSEYPSQFTVRAHKLSWAAPVQKPVSCRIC